MDIRVHGCDVSKQVRVGADAQREVEYNLEDLISVSRANKTNYGW